MIKNFKILIVEDEPYINRLIELALLSDGYKNIMKTYDGETALKLIKANYFDLILLDLLIPKINGYELCKLVKSDKDLKKIPLIIISARKEDEDIIRGFEIGAVDYITKPFSSKVLLARINARLASAEHNEVIFYGNLKLNLLERTCFAGNKAINLTNFEFELIELFLQNRGRVFTRMQLLNYLRGSGGFEVSQRAVDVQILNLRRKLGSLGKDIMSVRGVGYKLRGEHDNR